MKANCSIDPGANAIELDEKWYHWSFIAETIDQLCELLDRKGVPEGAEVALLCRNRPHQVAAFCAVICSGRCLTPINPFGSAEKIVEDLKDLDARVVIAGNSDWDSLGLDAGLQNQLELAISLDETRETGHVKTRAGVVTRDEGQFSAPRPDVAVLIQSSGTTGKPKRIPIGLKNLSSAYSKIPAGGAGESHQRIMEKPALITQPLVHIGGLFWVVHSLLGVRPISLLEKFDVRKWSAAVERHQIRVCSLVPAMINMVLESELPPKTIASLLCIRSGTAPLSTETQKAFEERFNVPILSTYGATEFSGAVCGWDLPMRKEFGDSKLGSVGRAYDGVELRVVDQKTGQPLPAGEAGILQVRSNQMMEDDWVATTDLASIDADEFIWLKGRADSAINRGGFKIVPSEVSDILEKHESIKEAVVVGLEDARLGQIPVAAVEARNYAEAPTENELKEWAKANMTSYFVPVHIEVVEQLPRTPSMKVSLAEVRKLFAVR